MATMQIQASRRNFLLSASSLAVGSFSQLRLPAQEVISQKPDADLAAKAIPKVAPNNWPGLDGEIRIASDLESFKKAVYRKGPALVVVANDIDLKGSTLRITSDKSVTGRFSPQAIQIIGGEVRVIGSNIRIDNLSFRAGDLGKKPGWEPDCLVFMQEDQGPVERIVVANCSFSWGIDENVSITSKIEDGPEKAPRDILFYRNLIAHSLHKAPGHSKNLLGLKGHGCGLLVHDFVQRVGIVQNVFAYNYYRNPMLKANTSCYMKDCLIVAPGTQAVKLQSLAEPYKNTEHLAQPALLVIENCGLIRGKSTPDQLAFIEGYKGRDEILSDIYSCNNFEFAADDLKLATPLKASISHVNVKANASKPLDAAKIRTNSLAILQAVGCLPEKRSKIDAQILSAILSGNRDWIINSQSEVGDYPVLTNSQNPDKKQIENFIKSHKN